MTFRHIAPLFAILVAALGAACGGGGDDTTPTPTGAPTPSPSETAASPSGTPDASALAEADRLYYEGYFEDAIDLYAAAASVPALRGDALWSLAVARFERGMRTEAMEALNALLNEELDPERERRARFLVGVIQVSRGETDTAREPLEEYVESGGPASGYAKLRLAQIAAKEEDLETAIAMATEAVTDGLAPGSETSMRFTLAEYHEEAGDVGGAIGVYADLADTADTAANRAEALWEMANLSYDEGFAETARTSLVRLVVSYPSDQRALEALSHEALTFGVSTFDRARVLFLHRLNEDAQTAFEAFLAEGPSAHDAANAHHHLGIISERFGAYEQALTYYNTAVDLLAATPADTIAANAMWDRALVLHLLGRLDEAVDAYQTLAQNAPNSEHAADALFAAGLVRYQQGRAGSAFEPWESYEALSTDPASIARAEFWLGKAHDALGDAASVAVEHYQAAARTAPTDYYGMRARALLDDDAAQQPSGEPDMEIDWNALEDWLAQVVGPEDTLATDAFFDERWDRALELRAIGLTIESDEELIDIRDDAIGSPWLLYRLARAAHDEEIAWLVSRAAGILASAYAEPPRDLLKLNYPLEYFDIVTQEAEANGISPYLLLGLVRQESLYDPQAVSPAQAMGLTQVIPTTAEQIASELSESDFRQPDLFRPHVSLRFGAYYLGSTRDYVGGSIAAALAGYNGGPGNAVRWQEQAGGDPDVFLEVIDFRETAAYVELVLENYALYLYAYGLVDTPSLPLQ